MAVFDIENIVYALKGRREEIRMSYKHEWVLIEATDDIDEMEHREPTEEFLFYRAVATGDIDKVKQNCEQERFMSDKGVGILSKDRSELHPHQFLSASLQRRPVLLLHLYQGQHRLLL